MKRVLFTSSFLLLLCFGCDIGLNLKKGNGQIIEQTTELNGFDNVNIGGNYHVKLYHSVKEEVSVTTDENLHQYIEIKVNNGELNIRSAYNLKPTDKVEIGVYYKSMKQITSGGASVIEHEDVLVTQDLEVDMTGAGVLKMDIDVASLDISVSGAGVVELSGYSDYQEVIMSGAGAYNASRLESDIAKINISGIGGAKIFAREEIDGTITGMGDIKYYGDPKKIVRHITGLGNIEKGDAVIEEDNSNV